MAQSFVTPDMVAPAALAQLENNLVMGKLVYRDLESMYEESKIGDTVRIRRPSQYTVGDGAVAAVQDTQIGRTALTVDQQKHVAIRFTSAELTLDLDKFTEQCVQPAMIQLANKIDQTVYEEAYKGTYNWVGTPGQTIDSFKDFAAGPNRLDNMAVPVDNRVAVLSPNDHWGLVGGFGNGANFFQPELAKTAIQKAKLPVLGNVDTYMSQNVSRHTVGAHGGTPKVDGDNQNVTYASVKDTWYQTFETDGWATSAVLNAGDVFTIDGVYMVNPVSKANTGILQQFTLITSVTTNVSAAANTQLTISPPIITSGAFQTVNTVPLNDADISYVGTAGTAYNQNLVFHKNAFALACVPLILPGGAASKGRYTKNGFSIRVVETYDGISDQPMWRFDVLFGVKCIDPRLATRLSGAA